MMMMMSRRDWESASAVTTSSTLAELIKLAMTSRWSEWLNNGQGWGQFTPIMQAKAGGHMTRTFQLPAAAAAKDPPRQL
jgi:hypothetical protein